MDFKHWLNEMPMQNFNRIGDWEPPKKPTDAYQKRRAPSKGYYSDDYGILTSDAGVEKIKRKWSKCPEPFNVVMLRSAAGAKQREEGMVDTAYLTNTLKLKPEDIAIIDQPDTINIIYTNNMGAERMPMNWWTMAHRVGHAINRSSFGGMRSTPQVSGYDYFIKQMTRYMYELLEQVFAYQKRDSWQNGPRGGRDDEKMMLALANEIGSMKSARERKLRNLTEFFHELTAQYIIEGKIHFREVPKMLIQSYAWGHPQGRWRRVHDQEDLEGWNEWLNDNVAPEIASDISHALHEAIGKIFVM